MSGTPSDSRTRRDGARDALAAVAIGLASVAALSTGALWELPAAKAAVGALRILDGEVPYRDFWTMYAPGQFYAVAGLFALFGREISVQAFAAVGVNGAAAGCLWWWLRTLGASRALSSVAALAFALSMWTDAPQIDSYVPVRPLLLVGLALLVRYGAAGGAARLAGAGFAFGCAAVFKHDVGAFASLGAVLSLAAMWLSTSGRPEGWLPPHRAAAWLLGAAALPVVPVVLALAFAAGADAWQDLVVFPVTDFQVVRSEPFPSWLPPWRVSLAWLRDPMNLRLGQLASGQGASWVRIRLPELIYLATAVALFANRRLDPSERSALWLTLCTLPFFWWASHTQRNTHPITMVLLCVPPLVVAWRRAPSPAARGLAAGLAVVLWLGLAVPQAARAFLMLQGLPTARELELSGVRGIRLPGGRFDAYDAVGRFVRQSVPPEEPVYVGLWRHDALVIPDLRLRLVVGRPSPVRYDELHPAVADREEAQEEMIAAIRDAGVRCAVLWKFGWPDERLDAILANFREELPELGATRLDEFLRENFEPVAEHGKFVVLWRKDSPRPADAPGEEWRNR